MNRFAFLAAFFVACSLSAQRLAPPAAPDAQLQVYGSKYYIIRTDLPAETVKEVVIRMNKMAEEYHARTQGFSGEIRERLPFYLFKTHEEYLRAGGLPGSAGVFDGSKLMAVAGEQPTSRTWHVVQHEGFHQFAHAVIRGELPTWLDEGIAEYFGESLFTGDAFVSGVVPPWRLRRLQEEIKAGRLKSIKDIMLTSHEQWNGRLSIENYDEAWSMVHFLAHGEDGRYQDAFVSFMRLIGRGIPWPVAWKQTFGDASGFEQRWREYWLKQPPSPTHELYVRAAAETFNSFLARATALKQHFTGFGEFLSAAKSGTLQTGQTIDDWLPPSLARQAAEIAEKLDVTWSLQNGADHMPRAVCVLSDGRRFIGNYTLRGGRITSIGLDIDDTASVIAQAQSLIDQGNKPQARALLQRALRAHPNSPQAEQVRKLIKQTS